MSKQHSKTAPAPSPYLSLRESVRPAILAYNLLEGEQGRVGILAAEIRNLLEATEDLLEAVGLVQMLSPGSQAEAELTADDGEHQARIVTAYSQAGMNWARIIGSCLNLADALLAAARWDDAHRLATYVKAAGEPEAADDIAARIDSARRKAAADAFWAKHSSFFGGLSNTMSVEDVQESFSILREVRVNPFLAPDIEKEMRKPVLESIARHFVDHYKGRNTVPQYVEHFAKLVARPNGWEQLSDSYTHLFG